MEERNGEKQENEVSRMNLLTRIKNWLEKEINTDWKVVALDLHQALIEKEEKNKELEEREKCLNHRLLVSY